MKVLGVISTAILFLLLVVSPPAYSQDRDETKSAHPQEDKDKGDKGKDKDSKQEDKAKHDNDNPSMRGDEHHGQSEAASPHQDQQEQKEQRHEERDQQKMERGEHQHPAQAQKGKRIPDDKFRAHFGRQHTFHVQRTQVINNPQPVVVFGGYSFQLIDVWPAEWAFDDDCYIDYVDGEYFLFDAFHPGIRVAVFVVE
jgi:hypothetical protein